MRAETTPEDVLRDGKRGGIRGKIILRIQRTRARLAPKLFRVFAFYGLIYAAMFPARAARVIRIKLCNLNIA